MTLELASIPLAWLARSASCRSTYGPWFLTLGLSLSFAVAGTLLLLNLGLDTDIFRCFAAALLVLVSLPLLSKPFEAIGRVCFDHGNEPDKGELTGGADPTRWGGRFSGVRPLSRCGVHCTRILGGVGW